MPESSINTLYYYCYVSVLVLLGLPVIGGGRESSSPPGLEICHYQQLASATGATV